MSPANTPVIFVHGQWLHATSWDPWVDLFREAGYAPLAPGWPGEADTVEETRRQPERVAGKGIDDVVAYYAQIIRGLDAPPIAIGHSFGSLFVQRPANRNLAVALTREQFRYGFGNALPAQESDELTSGSSPTAVTRSRSTTAGVMSPRRCSTGSSSARFSG